MRTNALEKAKVAECVAVSTLSPPELTLYCTSNLQTTVILPNLLYLILQVLSPVDEQYTCTLND